MNDIYVPKDWHRIGEFPLPGVELLNDGRIRMGGESDIPAEGDVFFQSGLYRVERTSRQGKFVDIRWSTGGRKFWYDGSHWFEYEGWIGPASGMSHPETRVAPPRQTTNVPRRKVPPFSMLRTRVHALVGGRVPFATLMISAGMISLFFLPHARDVWAKLGKPFLDSTLLQERRFGSLITATFQHIDHHSLVISLLAFMGLGILVERRHGWFTMFALSAWCAVGSGLAYALTNTFEGLMILGNWLDPVRRLVWDKGGFDGVNLFDQLFNELTRFATIQTPTAGAAGVCMGLALFLLTQRSQRPPFIRAFLFAAFVVASTAFWIPDRTGQPVAWIVLAGGATAGAFAHFPRLCWKFVKRFWSDHQAQTENTPTR